MDSQKKIFRLTFIFSVIVNVFLLGLLGFVVNDSLSGMGEFALTTKNMYYVLAIIIGFTILNGVFFRSIKKISKQ